MRKQHKKFRLNKCNCLLLFCFIICFFLSGCQYKTIIKNYEGPVFPLSATTDTTGITVERHITYDFSDYDIEKSDYDMFITGYRNVNINDTYTLTNTTMEDITMQAVYSFAGEGNSPIEVLPVITINQKPTEVLFVSGRTTSRYKAILEENGVENANDVYTLHNRACYELLLSNGIYKQEALEVIENVPILSQPVKVYKFTNLGYDGENKEITFPNATILFTADTTKTNIYSYGYRRMANSRYCIC